MKSTTRSHSRRATIRRRLIPAQDAPRGIHAATLKSRTRDDGTRWHPHIDTVTGAFWCDCPAGQHHKLCWHVRRLADYLHRHATPTNARINPAANPNPLRACVRCGQADSRFECVDDNGNVLLHTFLCADCVYCQADDADLCAPDHDGLMAAAPIYDQSLEERL